MTKLTLFEGDMVNFEHKPNLHAYCWQIPRSAPPAPTAAAKGRKNPITLILENCERSARKKGEVRVCGNRGLLLLLLLLLRTKPRRKRDREIYYHPTTGGEGEGFANDVILGSPSKKNNASAKLLFRTQIIFDGENG